MANRLEVEIGGKIKDFQNKVAQALKLTDKLKAKGKELEKSYKAGEISADKYYNALAQNASRLAKVTVLLNRVKTKAAAKIVFRSLQFMLMILG